MDDYSDEQDWQDEAERAAAPMPASYPRGALPVSPAYQAAPPPSPSPLQAPQAAQPAGPSRPQFDPSSFAPVYGAQQISFAKPAPPEGPLSDFAREAWVSTLGMGKDLLGAASLAANKLTSDPDVVGYIERQKAGVADYAAQQVNRLSPDAQASLHASIWGGKDDAGNAVPTPGQVGWGRYIGATVAGLIPQAALAALPGGIAGRVASAVAFGALDAGGAYNEMTSQVDQATPAQLMGSPVYSELVGGQVPQTGSDQDVQARRQLVSSLALPMGAAHFATRAVAGAGVGSLLTRGAAGAAGASLLRRVAIGAGEGAATMGGQQGIDDVIDQAAQRQAGLRQRFDPAEAAMQFATGAVGGAVLGAGGAALHGRATPVVDATPETAAVREALTPSPSRPDVTQDQLQLPAPPDRLQLTYDPSTPTQGDGFTAGAPPVPPPASAPVGRGFDADQVRQGYRVPDAPTPAPEPGPRQLTYDPSGEKTPTAAQGDGFTMNTPPPAVADPAYRVPDEGQGVPVRYQPDAPASPSLEADARTMSRPEMLAELSGLGVPVRGLAGMKLADLRDRVDAARAQARTVEPAETAGQQLDTASAPPAAPPIGQPAPVVPAHADAQAGEGAPAAPIEQAAPITRRQVQKQRMGQGAPVDRDAAAAVDTSASPDLAGQAAQVAHDQALASMRAAIPQLADMVAPLKRGDTAGVNRAIGQVEKELTSLVGRSKDKTAATVQEAVARWGRAGEVLPGTTTRRAKLADQIAQLMTGETAGLDTFGQDAAREAARQPVRVEREAAAAGEREAEDAQHEPVEFEAAPTPVVEPAPAAEIESPTRSPLTTDRARTAGDLLRAVLDGRKTVAEAQEQSIRRPGRAAGRAATTWPTSPTISRTGSSTRRTR